MEPAARVLIVEDEVIVAKDMEAMLRNLGYAVCGIVRTGEQGVCRARDEGPDLVLMDIGLKGEMDGIEAARQIRAIADIPLVYCTAISDLATFQRAKQTDPYGFICKPFEEKDLRSVVELALHHGRRERQLKLMLRLFRATLSCAEEALLVADVKVEVVYLNAAAEALTGWSEQEAVGVPLRELLVSAPGLAIPEIATLAEEGLAGILPVAFSLFTRDARRVAVSGSIQALTDAGVIGYLLRLRHAQRVEHADTPGAAWDMAASRGPRA
ncbi:MAG: response regulator [bacterium]|jgi:PAS domain S-box-containing protein|nr:response regulator [candidate division KSB1 bacterium]MDH7559365.1 response regulator [bacterium]